ncbi:MULTISPECIES: type 1 glutamine amidotransferase [Dietzia]|uniref:Lipid II isoglutaminyl synthase (glutamine-hydrolyzing) subunit GatD n=2 Tax=Dietzia cinnamea TaxID=321318 RepID=A0ABV3YHD4_9ACTN|nr:MULTISPECIES: glutamine amidotransferase [Dietzia]MBM7231245.1 glutamine amidotransferase [Dietzia cinnamea]PWD96723.1 glutamine amidotransferase [Dietzia maris]
MTMSEHHAGESNPDPRDAGARREGASASPLDTVAADSARPTESTVRIGLVLPDVMGTYGDDGNSLVLRQRLRWRGYDAEIVRITLEDAVPDSCDLYTVGGGEDAAQKLASRHLSASPGLQRAVERGAPVLAICAGMQVFGEWFVVSDGSRAPGLGLLDVTTSPQATRSIGELVVAPQVTGLTQPLTGFENHMGATVLGPDAAPLGRVTSGVGNGVPAGQSVPAGGLVEGVVQGSIIATYMHGPVLARNPELADLLLCRALGVDSLPPVEVPAVERLRRERIAAARR